MCQTRFLVVTIFLLLTCVTVMHVYVLNYGTNIEVRFAIRVKPYYQHRMSLRRYRLSRDVLTASNFRNCNFVLVLNGFASYYCTSYLSICHERNKLTIVL